jgi:uncharacterized protein (TIGR02118 family)
VVKLIFLCTRRPDISHEWYAQLLLEDHVPLALRHHPTLRRYTVNVVEVGPPTERPLDSIGALSFDTLADFRERLYDCDDGRRTIERDVARFMDHADAYVTTEHVQKAGAQDHVGRRTAGVKLVCPLRRRADLSHEQFVAHWLGTHVPLALEHHPQMVRYVTNVVDDRLSPDAPAWDGFAEISFASADEARTRLFASPESERIIRDDIARFIGHTFAYWVGEYVQRV